VATLVLKIHALYVLAYVGICIECSATPSALQIECVFACYVALSPAVN
jgi:hypothetical protein